MIHLMIIYIYLFEAFSLPLSDAPCVSLPALVCRPGQASAPSVRNTIGGYISDDTGPLAFVVTLRFSDKGSWGDEHAEKTNCEI